MLLDFEKIDGRLVSIDHTLILILDDAAAVTDKSYLTPKPARTIIHCNTGTAYEVREPHAVVVAKRQAAITATTAAAQPSLSSPDFRLITVNTAGLRDMLKDRIPQLKDPLFVSDALLDRLAQAWVLNTGLPTSLGDFVVNDLTQRFNQPLTGAATT